jgi:hypothetical protein
MKNLKIDLKGAHLIVTNPALVRALTDLNPTFMLYFWQDRLVTPREMDVICAYLELERPDLIEVPGLFEMLGECLNPKNNQI